MKLTFSDTLRLGVRANHLVLLLTGKPILLVLVLIFDGADLIIYLREHLFLLKSPD